MPASTQTSPAAAAAPAKPLVEVRGAFKHFATKQPWLGGLKTTLKRLLKREAQAAAQPAKQVVRALTDVTLSLQTGETMALVGESGCGKSTLLKAILQLIPLDAGEVFYKGQALHKLSGKTLRRIRGEFQLIFQNPQASLSPRMSVYDILSEPLRIHHRELSQAQRHARVLAMLERVDLHADTVLRYAHEFSGGQQQRIAIARALIAGPQFLAADEPVSALDVSVQAQILNLLMNLKRTEGFTCLFVTHDLAVARYVADRVTVMYLGSIVEQNTAEALFAKPLHPYTQLLLASVPKLNVPIHSVSSFMPASKRGGGSSPAFAISTGCQFAPRCPQATEVCRTQKPPLSPQADSGVAACHHI